MSDKQDKIDFIVPSTIENIDEAIKFKKGSDMLPLSLSSLAKAVAQVLIEALKFPVSIGDWN